MTTHTTPFLSREQLELETERLLTQLKAHLPRLEELLDSADDKAYEDPVYRFYHQSYKVFDVQEYTRAIAEALQAVRPERPLNPWFLEIVAAGTGRSIEADTNQNWTAVTRPVVEAFFHARFFLQMAVQYARRLEAPPAFLPSSWACLLHLYELR